MTDPLIALIALILSAMFVVGVTRLMQSAHTRRENHAASAAEVITNRRERIRTNPRDFLASAKTKRRPILLASEHNIQDLETEVDRANLDLANLPALKYEGTQYGMRVAIAPLFGLLIVASTLLNVEVFIALANGSANPAAITKGVAASTIEVLLSLVIGHLLLERSPRDLHWQLRLAFSTAIFISTIWFVAGYAPQRSALAYQSRYQLAENILARDRLLQNTQTRTVAVVADEATLRSLVADRARAEESDVAQTVILPLGELIASEWAIEGLALAALARRRRVAGQQAQMAEDSLRGAKQQHELLSPRLDLEVLAELDDAGVSNLDRALSTRTTTSAGNDTNDGRTTPAEPSEPPAPSATLRRIGPDKGSEPVRGNDEWNVT